MSRLTKQLKATSSLEKCVIRGPIRTSAKCDEDPCRQGMETTYRYEVKAEFLANVICRRNHLQAGIQSARQYIQESVYGEFVGRLMEIKNAAYSDDYQRVAELADSILADMRGDEI